VKDLVLAAIAVAIVAIAWFAGRLFRARRPAGSPSSVDKSEALFASMFPELQPHFHPEKLVAYVAARRGGPRPAMASRGRKRRFGGVSVDIRFVKDREECALVDAVGAVLTRFRYESAPDGGVLRVGAGKLTVDLRNGRDPAVRYWHPEREFKWTRRGGWRFKTPVSERPIDSSDRGTGWSDSSSSSDGVRTAAAAAGAAGLGGTFDGGGASASWGEEPAANGARDATDTGDPASAAAVVSGDADGGSGVESGSDSGSTSY